MTQPPPPNISLEDELERRIAALRADPEGQQKYDRNGDGIVDEQEWELVRRVIRRELCAERGEAVEHDEVEPTELGRVIHERYEIVGQLGRGAQGIMHLAHDRQNDQRVALKELSMGAVETWKAIELFEREAATLEGLQHPGIPTYIDHFHDQSDDELTFYLAQEHIEGETLSAQIDEGLRFGEEEARHFMLSMLGILDYLQSLNPPVVHRDIKPSNIICRADGNYALVDFGAVQTILPDQVGGSTVVGTSGYMPPEQLIGRARPASDIYALGATVVAAMSGREPHELDMMRMCLDFRPVVDASEAFYALLDQMLNPVVERRLQTAAEVIEAMESPLSRSPVGAHALVAAAGTHAASRSWPRTQHTFARLRKQGLDYNVFFDVSPQRLEVDIGPWEPPAKNWLLFVFITLGLLIGLAVTGCCGAPLLIPASFYLLYKGWFYLRPLSERLVLDADTLLLERHTHTRWSGPKLMRSETFEVDKLYLPHAHRHTPTVPSSARRELENDAQTTPPTLGVPGLIFTDTDGKRAAFAESLYTQHQFTRVGHHDDQGALDWLDELVSTYLSYLRDHDID